MDIEDTVLTPDKPETQETPETETPSGAVRRTGRSHKKLRPLLAAAIVIALLAAAAAAAWAVLYRDVRLLLVSELGEGIPEAAAFLKNDGLTAEYMTPTDGIDDGHEGAHLVELSVDGRVRPCLLVIRDTVAPAASGVETTITIDQTLSPEELLSGITDRSVVTVAYRGKVSFGVAGDYDVDVVIKDGGGNRTVVTVPLHIRAVADLVEYEAGDERPALEDFLLVERTDAAFVTDMSAIAWDRPGEYDVSVNVDGVEYVSCLRVTDTVAPVITLRPLVVTPGSRIDLMELIASSADETELTFTFDGQADGETPGEYAITVTATDAGGNTAAGESKVVVSKYLLEVEARQAIINIFELGEAIGVYGGLINMQELFTPDTVGAYAFTCSVSGEDTVVAVVVRDTVPPTGTPQAASTCTGYPIDASSFVTGIYDITDVVASYKTQPDWSKNGVQAVTVYITDEGGNSTEIDSTLEIAPDTEGPRLYNVRDRYCYVDEAVAYFKEIFAEDNADPDVKVTVDKSEVDIHKEGQYQVSYTAEDRDGNKTEHTCVYTFIEQKVTDEELDKLAQEVFDQIFTEDMTNVEQAWAIYNYVYNHVMYVNGSDKTDWKSEAYRGITTGSGDCFTCYSVEYLLLSKIDCQLMSVERLGGSTRHYWCLVDLGTGWYHFDGCNAGPENYKAFMSTNYELWFLGPGYWAFDTAMYPEVATTPFWVSVAK